ncbi:uncharacterized protein LOC127573830 [Pristis pectinata]|uniref:uncharacterized protein LOC127573830 n=1 Tax=Pristis pectinata TaxID=685728 RepID=UPI00223D9CFA|nr:uncharacterized protein LOC127573830 [Pristis pectinata]
MVRARRRRAGPSGWLRRPCDPPPPPSRPSAGNHGNRSPRQQRPYQARGLGGGGSTRRLRKEGMLPRTGRRLMFMTGSCTAQSSLLYRLFTRKHSGAPRTTPVCSLTDKVNLEHVDSAKGAHQARISARAPEETACSRSNDTRMRMRSQSSASGVRLCQGVTSGSVTVSICRPPGWVGERAVAGARVVGEAVRVGEGCPPCCEGRVRA